MAYIFRKPKSFSATMNIGKRIFIDDRVKDKYTKICFSLCQKSFFFFLQYQGLNPGAFYLWATPPVLIFILYLETGSQ